MNQSDTKSLPEQVREEERLLKVVLATAKKPREWVWTNYEADLLRLRDELAEEKLPEDRASLIEQMERVARLAKHQASSRTAQLDSANPYFGHMRLVTDDGERRDVLIGKQTFIKDGVRIVDWRNAPISQAFYQGQEGDDYAVHIAGRLVEGEISLRRTLAIRSGELLRVKSADNDWRKEGEEWVEVIERKPQLQGGAGSAARPESMGPVLGVGGAATAFGHRDRVDKHLPEIVSLLDAEQFQLITRPDSGIVAIQGSAGSGKTTVALHRVAYLAFHDPRRFSPRRTLIIVFSPALALYISRVLPALGVEGVSVRTFESWSLQLRRRLYPRYPTRYSDETPGVVSRFKLHSALIPMLKDGAEVNPDMRPWELFDELFTTKAFLSAGLNEYAPGEFSPNEVTLIHRWCSSQHSIRDDGGGLRDYEKPALDAEDDAILLYLYQLANGYLPMPNGRPVDYAHLVVDEAQDLSPLELQVLLGSVQKDGLVTLAGDTAQQLIESNDFKSWDQVLGALGREHIEVSPLNVSYRSTYHIARLARAVLGPLAPKEPLVAIRDGVSPELFRFDERGQAFSFLTNALKALVDAEPTANVALLCRYEAQVTKAWNALSRADLPSLHKVSDYDFRFSPGIEIAEIRKAKGLEFDYVVVLHADDASFPEDPASRHHLHVGITRAAYQCWLVCVGNPSSLLPDWMPIRGMV
ncbi:MAG TPA: DNA helicase UvrD [Myxococcales bacterium]|nr:DNA helicase UvrD [Myxococcales bacterium]